MTKALTLHQPWASLCVPLAPDEKPVKTIETRCKPTKYRGRLLIHASLNSQAWRSIAPRIFLDNIVRRRFPAPMKWSRTPPASGETTGVDPTHNFDDLPYRSWLPLGAIVGSCELVDVVPVGETADDGDQFPRVVITPKRPPLFRSTAPYPELVLFRDPMEQGVDISHQRPYGDFTPGRYAWLLEDAKRTDERCPACWGEGLLRNPEVDVVATTRLWESRGFPQALIDQLLTGESFMGRQCPTCDGEGSCPPIPAKGKQGLWEWTP